MKTNDSQSHEEMEAQDHKLNSSDELAPLDPALNEENNRTAKELLSRYGLKTILVLSAGLLVSVSFNFTQGYWLRHQEHKYFATNNGSIVPQHPTDKPAYPSEDVLDFANKTMVNTFALNFVNYENQLTSVRPSFTKNGYDNFRKALTNSQLLDKIQKKRLNLKMSSFPGSLVTEGVIEGTQTYAWQFRIPVTFQLVGQAQDYQPENYDLFVQVQQVDVRDDPKGIQLTQVILKPRAS